MTYANSFTVRSIAFAALVLLACVAAEGQVGPGTVGAIARFDSSNSVGNSSIFEDKYGKVGVGTSQPTSKLTVAGTIESQSGGIKFPDGTVQTTAIKDPALSAFQKRLFIQLGTGEGNGSAAFFVPTNKRAIIEFITIDAFPGAQNEFGSLSLQTYVNDESMDHEFLPTITKTSGGFVGGFGFQNMVKIYADGNGPPVRLTVARNGALVVVGRVTFTISGYLVDLPESANRQVTGPVTGTQLGSSGPIQTKGVKQ